MEHKQKRLSDMSLHKADLDFAENCLNAINTAPEEPNVTREALWRSAIVHFIKCFGDSSSRFQLSHIKVLKSEPGEAKIAFEYFKNIRNKHIIHDENSYAQSIPGAILNKGDKSYKIEKIICFTAITATLDQTSYGNLILLIQKTRAWVITEFDQLCISLTTELEKESYTNLVAKESMEFRVPKIEELHKKRDSFSKNDTAK